MTVVFTFEQRRHCSVALVSTLGRSSFASSTCGDWLRTGSGSYRNDAKFSSARTSLRKL